jgi:hypothetical protein
MNIVREREACKIRLRQNRAVRELLLEYVMQNAKGRAVPMSVAEKPTPEGEKLDMTRFPYARLVGSLLYLSNCTRPDITQAVGVFSRFMSEPTHEHLRMACAVLASLAGTPEMGLEYGGSGADLELSGYVDANYAGLRETSTPGVRLLAMCSHSGAISWASKCQPTVACSKVEAEYMGAAFADKGSTLAQEAVWGLGAGLQDGQDWL